MEGVIKSLARECIMKFRFELVAMAIGLVIMNRVFRQGESVRLICRQGEGEDSASTRGLADTEFAIMQTAYF